MAPVPAARRRPQLIKTAIALMTREGVAVGSTRAIAAELGVAQATVRYTFGTKEDLYRAVMDQLIADMIAQVEGAAPQEADFGETIAALANPVAQRARGVDQLRTATGPACVHCWPGTALGILD